MVKKLEEIPIEKTNFYVERLKLLRTPRGAGVNAAKRGDRTTELVEDHRARKEELASLRMLTLGCVQVDEKGHLVVIDAPALESFNSDIAKSLDRLAKYEKAIRALIDAGGHYYYTLENALQGLMGEVPQARAVYKVKVRNIGTRMHQLDPEQVLKLPEAVQARSALEGLGKRNESQHEERSAALQQYEDILSSVGA